MPTASSAFESLHPSVQKWVYRQNWTHLRDLQEQAIAPIQAAERDVILAAATASGKTEAAFLPILSRLAERKPQPGFGVLCVSPLKALINDQYDRLGLMGEATGIPIHRWHGDVAQNRKTTALRNPSGVLLITPESLEALFVRRGLEVPGLFAGLAYVVVDELHAFMGDERGRQLQSLLHRVDLAIRRSCPRIALSATLGDMRQAAEYLRPGDGERAVIIEGSGDTSELRMQLRGYVEEAPDDDTNQPSAVEAIADHLYQHLRGHDNLAFANSRAFVELLSDRLRLRCEADKVPIEFFPHHGNLSRELRESVEAALGSNRPTTAVCTSTLELGIDVGSVHSIAQIGPPPSVASLRQRLGRSGRRAGEAAILRMYVTEPPTTGDDRADVALRLKLVQSIAMVDLLLDRWYEPPGEQALHLSTLVQQVLSMIAQHGGARANQLFSVLCAHGPFRRVTPALFGDLLRCLGKGDVLHQSSDGTLMLGPVGERLTGHYSFYAAFATQDEYRLVCGGSSLGTLPVTYAVMPGMHLVFAGKRWKVLAVEQSEKRITVEAGPAGTAPSFGTSVGGLHTRVVQQMKGVYERDDAPGYLDARANTLLSQGRRQYAALKLADRALVPAGEDTLLFPWLGSRALDALALALAHSGVAPERYPIHLSVPTSAADLKARLRLLARRDPSDPAVLADLAQNKATEKHHRLLSDDLLSADYASSHLDVAEAWEWLRAWARTKAV